MSRRTFASIAAAGATLMLGAVAADADQLKSYTKKAAFDDVRADISDAVIKQGLTIDYRGNIGGMLDRTGADVGSTKKVYKQAEFITFCSARLSRAMMEADPANMGFCPYVIFYYEPADQPGQIVVGYRRPDEGKNPASKAALAAIDSLLDGIVKEAAK